MKLFCSASDRVLSGLAYRSHKGYCSRKSSLEGLGAK